MNLHNDHVCRTPPPDPYFVPADFARQLERELTELRERFKREVEDAFMEGVAVGRLQGTKDARSLYLAVSRARRVVETLKP